MNATRDKQMMIMPLRSSEFVLTAFKYLGSLLIWLTHHIKKSVTFLVVNYCH